MDVVPAVAAVDHRHNEEVSCVMDDDDDINSSINNINHSLPTYRYNHYPRRSSSCYSSSNLASYSSCHQQWIDKCTAKSPSPTSFVTMTQSSSATTTCMSSSELSSDDVSSSPPSPQTNRNHVENLSPRDEFSIQSALSLYQAFANYSESNINSQLESGSSVIDNADCHAGVNDLWATNVSIDEEDERSPTNHLSNAQSRSQGEDCILNAEHDGQSSSSLDEVQSNETKTQDEEHNNGRKNANSDDANHDDSESVNSQTSFTPTNNSLQSSSNFVHRHRRKIASLLLSMITALIYARYRKSKQFKSRYYLLNGYHHSNIIYNLGQGKLLSVCRWLTRLLSPFTISNNFRKTVSSITPSSSQIIQPPSPSSVAPSSWNNVPITPLSHLLAMSKSNDIRKVILRGPVLSYLHSVQSSSRSISSPTTSSPADKPLRWSQTTLPSRNPNILNEIITTLINHGCEDITTLPDSLIQRILNGPAVMALPFAYLAALYWMMRRLQRQQFDDDDRGDGSSSWKKGGGGGHPTTTTFEDVAGIDSSLQELSEVISYMRNPEIFHAVGAQPPRGILLHGPAGSGKTLLARAIAGEAERCVDGIHHLGGNTIDCFAVCSGSEFVETYVGRGAARIRSLFQNVRAEAMRNFKRRQSRQSMRWSDHSNNISSGNQSGIITRTIKDLGFRLVGAWDGVQSLSLTSGRTDASNLGVYRHQQPMAIIFIDEIDVLAKRRDSGLGLPSSLGGGGCDEREQTLNQLLTEMDGFDTGDSTPSATRVNVIVIAATNRPGVLDPAIMRPGRFDRHVRVNLPDARGRVAILRVHARRIRWDRSSVDFAALPTHNFSGADLKNVINEAALLAVRSGSSAVTQIHLMAAVQKVRDQQYHC